MESYAVVWREEEGPLYAGKLELGPDSLRLQGSSPDGLVASRAIAYGELGGVRIGRAPSDRINGRPSVVLDRGVGRPVSIGAVSGAGIVHEVAQLLSELAAEKRDQATRVVVVVPLKPAAAARARELVRVGPPFDPEVFAVERHHVFVTEREVVFLFEGADARAVVRQLARRPGVLEAAAGWAALLAGSPLVADEAYSWVSRPLAA